MYVRLYVFPKIVIWLVRPLYTIDGSGQMDYIKYVCNFYKYTHIHITYMYIGTCAYGC